MKPVYGSFGIYRWILATLVMITHLGPKSYNYVGSWAVFAFFMLSGYVITYILKTHYFRIQHGLAKYFLNRALRVYPLYWIALITTVFFLNYIPEARDNAHSFMTMPEGSDEWLKNITALGLSSATGDLCRHIPVLMAWSLGTELLFWICLPYILSHISHLKTFLFFSVAYATLILSIVFIRGDIISWRYFSPLGGFLPFACGILLYFRKTRHCPDMNHAAGVILIAMTLLFALSALRTLENPGVTGFYYSIPLNAAIIYYLSGIEGKSLPDRVRLLDELLGRLSYPMFLFQMIAGVMAKVIFPALPYGSWAMFITAFLICNAIGCVALWSVEFPVGLLRQRVRA